MRKVLLCVAAALACGWLGGCAPSNPPRPNDPPPVPQDSGADKNANNLKPGQGKTD